MKSETVSSTPVLRAALVWGASIGGIAVVLVGGTLVLTPLFYRGGLWLIGRLRRGPL